MQYFWHILFVITATLPNLLAYNLVLGRGKIFHFGPMGLSLVAAYGTFVPLMAGYGYPFSLLIGLILALAASLVFAWMSLRLSADGFGVMTIAMHLGILTVVLNWNSLTRGALGIPRVPRFSFLEPLSVLLRLPSTATLALFSLVICALWIIVVLRIDRGRFGRNLQALAEHEWYASALGISRSRMHIAVFALSAVGALFSNVLYDQYLGLVHPSDFGFPIFIFFITVVVAGRPGSVWGTVIAATLLTLLREAIRFFPIAASIKGPVQLMLFGVILIVAVWWRRDVLFPGQRSV